MLGRGEAWHRGSCHFIRVKYFLLFVLKADFLLFVTFNSAKPGAKPLVCFKGDLILQATLIVTPASLISHWLEQIDRHIDDRVDLKVMK